MSNTPKDIADLHTMYPDETKGVIDSMITPLNIAGPHSTRITELAEPIPSIISFDKLLAEHPTKPDSLIEGVIGRGDKMIVSAPSKAGKSWLLADLAFAASNGHLWLGHQCTQMNVLYVNFEISPGWLANRGRMLLSKKGMANSSHLLHPSVLNLRGFELNWMILEQKILDYISNTGTDFDLIILDPIYKMLGDADENSNGNIASLLNSLERMGHRTRAAVVFAHHHSKGNKSGVDASERMAGAGVWARDPDAIVDLIPHEDEDCYIVETITRNYARPPKFVVKCDFPAFIPITDANPNSPRKPGGSSKKLTKTDVVDMCNNYPSGITSVNCKRQLSDMHHVSEETARKRINEAVEQGLILKDGKNIKPRTTPSKS